jgi:CRP-like cAMP-binding protein
MNRATSFFSNRILSSLPPEQLDHFRPHLSAIDLPRHKVLEDGINRHVYFLEEGIASVVLTVADGTTVEVGVVGRDGLVGLPLLLDVDSGLGQTFMQIAGSGYRIEASLMRAEFERPGALRERLQKYTHAFMVQTAQTAVCNRLHGIEERLARWLLTCRDRMDTDRLELTHDFVGQMLGAPRSTVSLAAGLLQNEGAIEYSRGVVLIKDRQRLAKAACECYRAVCKEFQRLNLL